MAGNYAHDLTPSHYVSSMIFSTIDIGTNTILMVTAAAGPDGTIQILGDEHAIARLGKGVDARRVIMPETFDRMADFLLRYRQIAESHNAERIVAFGTSALRDARNRQEFIAEMAARTGITIEVLSGHDEARWTYRGALFGIAGAARQSPAIAVIDIGGGSTEIAVGNGSELQNSISIDIGAVRVTERCFPNLPPSAAELASARTFACMELEKAFRLPPQTVAVGVAGTVTTLGAMHAGMNHFNAEELNGRWLPAGYIHSATERLAGLTLAETAAIPQINSGRADIILAGAIILDEFMRRYQLPALMVSTRGVRYGVMLRELGQQPPQ